MRVDDFERAPNPRRVRAFVAEKGMDIELGETEVNHVRNR